MVFLASLPLALSKTQMRLFSHKLVKMTMIMIMMMMSTINTVAIYAPGTGPVQDTPQVFSLKLSSMILITVDSMVLMIISKIIVINTIFIGIEIIIIIVLMTGCCCKGGVLQDL